MSLHEELSQAQARINELEYQLANVDAKNKKNEDIIQELKKQLQKAKDFEKVATSAIEALSNKS